MRMKRRFRTRSGLVKIAPPAIFTFHAVDEYFGGFPEWATRHFGTTSRRFYVVSHVLLVAAVSVSSMMQVRRPQRRATNLVLGAIVSGFVMNGIFHIETSLRFEEPSPGLRTAIWLLIPGGAATLASLIGGGMLDRRDLTVVIAGGILLNAAAVGSLRLDMPELE